MTPEERLLAEEWRDAYLAACKAQKVKPVPLGVYLRDRKFLDAQARAGEESTVETIKVSPFGPVWAAQRMLALLAGPEAIDSPTTSKIACGRITKTCAEPASVERIGI
ncbi:hypothetical protein SS05631_c30180 [Sinorhizobium sp. CCBAU 05631]|nr:hypothetical protein SS05631_c30180 [Sinorhizobium sp. CCBAU 05631]